MAGEGVELVDLSSTNGTFVNGVAIARPILVRPGDDIRLGKVKIWIEVRSTRVSAVTGRFAPFRTDILHDSPDETTTAFKVDGDT